MLIYLAACSRSAHGARTEGFNTTFVETKNAVDSLSLLTLWRIVQSQTMYTSGVGLV